MVLAANKVLVVLCYLMLTVTQLARLHQNDSNQIFFDRLNDIGGQLRRPNASLRAGERSVCGLLI